MSQLVRTLGRLAQTFAARDIMTPTHELKRASDLATAQRLLGELPVYDVIPIEQNGRLTSYLDRKRGQVAPIRLSDVVSDATSILDLVDVLRDHRYTFVLHARNLVGYIHFSDLNNNIVKLPFFVLIEALERYVVELIAPLVTDESLEPVLGPQRASEVKRKMNQQRENRSDLDLINLLYFREALEYSRRFNKLDLEGRELDTLGKVRNLVSHAAAEPLVESHQDVGRLSETKRLCISLLGI